MLKISNGGEDAAVLDLEEAAIAHVAAVDPALPVARPLAPRATFDGHEVRLFELLHGRKAGPELDDAAVRDDRRDARPALPRAQVVLPPRGGQGAALGSALRAAPAPSARRDRPTRNGRRSQRARSRATRSACCRGGRACALRSSTATSTSTTSSLDEHGRLTGILDFGDCCHTALAADLAVALASFLRGRPPDDLFRVARIALDGFSSRLPLEPLELELLGDLVSARLAAIVSISAWRVTPLPRERGLHRGLGRRLLAAARAPRPAGAGGGGARARRAESARHEPRSSRAGEPQRSARSSPR